MRTLIVGDIHGCYDELQALLDRAGLATDDAIISIGDMVDRGPDSARALNYFRQTPQVRAIMGNHERKHVRWLRGEIQPAASQVIARYQIGEADYPAAVEFMDRLPRFLELPEAVLVHGFYEPGVALEEQRESVIVGTLSGEAYLREQYTWPWYELYDGLKPLIVGHRDYTDRMQVLNYRDRVYGIDTRCVYGGSLTGLLLPEFRLVAVPSRGDYWSQLQQQHADLLSEFEAK